MERLCRRREYARLAEKAFAHPIRDLDGLDAVAMALQDSGVEQVVKEALEEASGILPGPGTTVCIYALDPDSGFVCDYLYGVTGLTPGAGRRILWVYPSGDWRHWVAYTVAHEYHHSVWTRRHFRAFASFDLLDYMVFEGRADSFARMVYPGTTAPWTDALTPAQELRQWQVVREYLDTTSIETQRRFMFGRGDVSLWTGYTIGYHIVQAYLGRHPHAKIDGWTAMGVRDMLAESGYVGEP